MTPNTTRFLLCPPDPPLDGSPLPALCIDPCFASNRAQVLRQSRSVNVPAFWFIGAAGKNVRQRREKTQMSKMETSISRMYSDFSGHFISVYQRAVQFYWWCMSRSDPRVANWPLMASPVPTLLITLVYLICVHYGRKWMTKRKPFSLRWILIPYNLSMCCLNLYIALELAVTQYRKQYNWLCQPVNYSEDPDEIRIASALWWYYFSRLVEMMDTMFLVLRKKWKQLTFLHVYHHSTMFMLWWIGVKWVPGGSAFFAAMVNCFIHVIMYLYYALASCGPKIQKYLFWKKYLTILQMAQFISALVLGVRALVFGCDFPLWMQYALVFYMASFLFLFGQYYRTAYLQKKQKTR